MAAIDTFEDYLRALPFEQSDRRRKMIAQCRSELLAARSEEARVRLVQEFTRAMAAPDSAHRRT
jgi:hypothetical protein